jgi:hypothetical protein
MSRETTTSYEGTPSSDLKAIIQSGVLHAQSMYMSAQLIRPSYRLR